MFWCFLKELKGAFCERALVKTKPVLVRPSVNAIAPGGAASALQSSGFQTTRGRNLRQAFQVARERIRDSQPIAYWSSEDPQYIEFKRLACAFGTIVGSSRYIREPSSEEAAKTFSEITSNRYEGAWKGVFEGGPQSENKPPK